MTAALLALALGVAAPPDAAVDLTTAEGVRLVDAAWRHRDAGIVEVDFRAPDGDGRPNGAPIPAFDITPHAGAADFDDAAWEVVEPAALRGRRTSGRLSFNWYRLNFRVPERIGGFDPAGSTIVFDIVVDDYAEVWVDGALPRALGQSGGSLVAGWNAPNRLVVARNVRPGQRIQLAVFGANGPLSEPPPNYIWIRSARLEFFRNGPETGRRVVETEIRRLDPALDAIVQPGTQIEQLASGFQFTEGPVWLPEGALLFSDPNANRIYRWSAQAGVSIFKEQSGYAGADVGEYKQPGSNGLALDAQGRLTIDEHGNRRVTRAELNGSATVLAERYEGRRLNSPNDLVYRSDGSLYFTDPPFGLPRVYDDPGKELPFSGVFRAAGGQLQLLASELKGPNGIAFSPDERYLYVGNWDETAKIVKRYGVRADGTLDAGTVFFDLTAAPGEEAIDGVKTDAAGNVYVSGPGGLWIVSPEGKALGVVKGPELPANMAWGDDGRTLYLTARTGLYRIRLKIAGHVTAPASAEGTRPTAVTP